MQKKIEKIIDWKGSMVYALFIDGTKGYAHANQTTYRQQQTFRGDQEAERQLSEHTGATNVNVLE